MSHIGRKNKIELNQPRSMEKKFLVGWLTPETLTNINLTRQVAQFCIQSVLIPTGLFQVETCIYIPNNFNGLYRRPLDWLT
jgi:hypothetical protein